jgi:putative DNA primase/helicase
MCGDGLWFVPEGDEPSVQLSGPFNVPGLARDPSGVGWATTIEWRDRDGIQHRAFVPHSDLIGDGTEWLRPLVDAGLPVSSGRKPLALLKQALFNLDCPTRVRLVKRSGWFGSAFVLPKETIGAVDDGKVLFNGRADAARYAQAGTLEEWIAKVAVPATGNSRLLLALSVAFAGPVADLLQDEGGGVNLRGGSSSGKSTALIVAGSVWGGGGRAGFTQTWRATGNGLESVARAHSGTLLVLDELGELDAREAGATAYLLVNGQGKARATKEAARAARVACDAAVGGRDRAGRQDC